MAKIPVNTFILTLQKTKKIKGISDPKMAPLTELRVSEVQVSPTTSKNSRSRRSSRNGNPPVSSDGAMTSVSEEETLQLSSQTIMNDPQKSEHNSFVLPHIEECRGAEYDSDADKDCSASVTSRMSQPFVQFGPSIYGRRGMTAGGDRATTGGGAYAGLGFNNIALENEHELVACVSSLNIDALSDSSLYETPPLPSSAMTMSTPLMSQGAQQGRVGKLAKSSSKKKRLVTKIKGRKSRNQAQTQDVDEESVVSAVTALVNNKTVKRSASLPPARTDFKSQFSCPTGMMSTENSLAVPMLSRQHSDRAAPMKWQNDNPMLPTPRTMDYRQGSYETNANGPTSVHTRKLESEPHHQSFTHMPPDRERCNTSQGSPPQPRRKISISGILRPNQFQNYAQDEDSHTTGNGEGSQQSTHSFRPVPVTSDTHQYVLSHQPMMSHSGQSGLPQSAVPPQYVMPNGDNSHHVPQSYSRQTSSQAEPTIVAAKVPKEKVKSRLARLIMSNHVQADFDIGSEIRDRVSYHSDPLELEVEGSLTQSRSARGLDASGSSKTSAKSGHQQQQPRLSPRAHPYHQGGPHHRQDDPHYPPGDSQYYQGGPPFQQSGPLPYQQDWPPYNQGPPYQQGGGPQQYPRQEYAQGPPQLYHQGGPPQQYQHGIQYQQQGAPLQQYPHGLPYQYTGPPQQYHQEPHYPQGGPSYYHPIPQQQYFQNGPPPPIYPTQQGFPPIHWGTPPSISQEGPPQRHTQSSIPPQKSKKGQLPPPQSPHPSQYHGTLPVEGLPLTPATEYQKELLVQQYPHRVTHPLPYPYGPPHQYYQSGQPPHQQQHVSGPRQHEGYQDSPPHYHYQSVRPPPQYFSVPSSKHSGHNDDKMVPPLMQQNTSRGGGFVKDAVVTLSDHEPEPPPEPLRPKEDRRRSTGEDRRATWVSRLAKFDKSSQINGLS